VLIVTIATSLECGADNFIRKPYDPAALVSRIDHILSNQRLRKASGGTNDLEIYLAGKKHVITSAREQILDLLISSYEQAIQVNEALKDRERAVGILNFDLRLRAVELESASQERTSHVPDRLHARRARKSRLHAIMAPAQPAGRSGRRVPLLYRQSVWISEAPAKASR
jgi:hypothetical protein